MSQGELEQYAPTYVGKYDDLCPEDAEFLSHLPREPRTKLDGFLKLQRDKFLENMQDLTRKQEIDAINGDITIKRSELNRQKAELDQQIQQFDQQVKQSDHGMAEAAEEIEFARRKKLER